MAQFQPLANTSMPYFLNNRTTSSSSLKTRQRETYEASHDPVSRPHTPQLKFTLPDGDSDDEDEVRCRRPSIPDTSYPACELPFSSEPALESELEIELPPLKKLRSSRNGGVSEDGEDSGFCPETVRGILTKKDQSFQSSPEGSGHSSPVQTSPVSQEPASLPLSKAHVLNGCPDPRPSSRRNSSCQSAVSSLNSNKTVRFATGNSPPTCNTLCQRHQPSDDTTTTRCSCHLENPVATVMYLTHSAKVYDRTSIVVEKSLRLPPRQDASECGRWVPRCESSTALEGRERSKLGLCSPIQNPESDQTASRNKDCEAWRDKNHAITSDECQGIFQDTFTSSPSLMSFPSMASHPSSLNLQQFRKQEQFEEDLDDEDEEAESETEVDDDDEVDCSGGTWSQGQVFKDDDILGGF
ncbi:hypothetical protein DFH28DRAFT_942593 [Melampsora americana]|nr:hypothetical protein DFH28DRAFT_942593 [Melampsora americana]